MEEAAKASQSVSGVMRYLGMKLTGGSHFQIKRKLRVFNIDCSHFTRRGCHIGNKNSNLKRTWQQILVVNNKDKREFAYVLRRALIESGVKYECVGCGNTGIWQNEKITLQVHHKNTNWSDNSKDNLEFLCPNCHSIKHENMAPYPKEREQVQTLL